MKIILLFKVESNALKHCTEKRKIFGGSLLMCVALALSSSVLAAPDLTFASVTGFSTSYYVGQPMPKFTLTIINSGNSTHPAVYNDQSRMITVMLEDCYYKNHADGKIYSCPLDLSMGGPKSVTHILSPNGLSPSTSFVVNWPLLWPGMPTKPFKIAGDYHMLFRILANGGGEASTTNNSFPVDFTVNTTSKNFNLKPGMKPKLIPKKVIKPN